jgi:hypothetical protein
MNLADKDILELNELCNALVDGSISEKQTARLSSWLSTSEDARQFYVRVMGLSASLCYYASEMQTSEMQAQERHIPAARAGFVRTWAPAIGAVAFAACLLLVLRIAMSRHDSHVMAAPSSAPTAVAPLDDHVFVARLTGSRQCQWVNSAAVAPGEQLREGQHIELAKGFAEITFDSGAVVVMQGPASLDVNSAWSATLNRGTLKASLPPEAMGFSISNPTVEVVDLGTEFTMFSDASGAATEVLVLKGEVEAAPKNPVDQPPSPIVLREKESRRFAASGVSTVHDSDQKFAELTQPVPLTHFVSPVGYAHWSFDETEGNIFKVSTSGLADEASAVQLENLPQTGLGEFHIKHQKGNLGGALHFDGRIFAKAAYPGISENSPHTVLFWVRVPKDATLSNAYSMVAWGVNNKQLRSHPIQIDWNRWPGDGMVGALRTDYGGGFAVGGTQLRDGRWHHIGVVFIPRDDAQRPMEVKQYVDGILEGEGKPSKPGGDAFMHSAEYIAQTANGTILLGCRLGKEGVRSDYRFYGDLDELFIADRALEPQEIVHLMNTNQLQY